LKRCQYSPPLTTLVNLRTREAVAAGSRCFYFSFYFSSIAKSAGGFVCPSRKVAGSKPKTKKKTGPARRHRGDIRMPIDLSKPIACIFAAASWSENAANFMGQAGETDGLVA
jgi:hypothetical protein